MNTTDIQNFLNLYNYDIRISRNARFMDQKVTPDVLCIVADCICEYLNNHEFEIEFTSTNIREQEYSNHNVKNIFNKPGIDNSATKNEYDKFFQQPLKMLAYANILSEEKKGTQIFFKINKNGFDILKYISLRERNSFEFLILYLKKVLLDSNLDPLFKIFLTNPDIDNYINLKKNFEDFIIMYTPINNILEPRRIFPKILNPLSFKYKVQGTKKGFFSKAIITWDELMYNRPNFRDLSKDKNITRVEAFKMKNEKSTKTEAYIKYTITKAKKFIHNYYEFSEINSEIASIYHIHHIYPQNQFPEFKSYTENLIKLTPAQHFENAHPYGTQYIDLTFQRLCILTKIKHIETYLSNGYEDLYSKDSLVNLLNSCLFIKENNDLKINESSSFLNIRYNIISAYEKIIF
ncbi:hypothetical protein [Cetobacterium sp.]|uniref:hypothetical protein n=1 Tax=Cetobacterium sp. TaxID=2071632 RepID=UPI003F30DA05